MFFDVNNLSDKKKRKIVMGTLRYIVIKESFKWNIPLDKNILFRTYFSNFYGLNMSAFSQTTKKDSFFSFFDNCKKMYLNSTLSLKTYDQISKGLTCISGNGKEESFPSKILHTIDNNSPIIDKNVKVGLQLNNKSVCPVNVYNKLLDEYCSVKVLKINPHIAKLKKIAFSYTPKNGTGMLALADANNDNWYDSFDKLCGNYIKGVLTGTRKVSTYTKKKISEILKEICIAIKGSAEKSIIEKLFANTKNKDLLQEIESQLGIDIIDFITNISEVKKIDFYLWALFAK